MAAIVPVCLRAGSSAFALYNRLDTAQVLSTIRENVEIKMDRNWLRPAKEVPFVAKIIVEDGSGVGGSADCSDS